MQFVKASLPERRAEWWRLEGGSGGAKVEYLVCGIRELVVPSMLR